MHVFLICCFNSNHPTHLYSASSHRECKHTHQTSSLPVLCNKGELEEGWKPGKFFITVHASVASLIFLTFAKTVTHSDIITIYIYIIHNVIIICLYVIIMYTYFLVTPRAKSTLSLRDTGTATKHLILPSGFRVSGIWVLHQIPEVPKPG